MLSLIKRFQIIKKRKYFLLVHDSSPTMYRRSFLFKHELTTVIYFINWYTWGIKRMANVCRQIFPAFLFYLWTFLKKNENIKWTHINDFTTWVTFNKNFKENTYLSKLKWLIFYRWVYSVIEEGEIVILKEAEFKVDLAAGKTVELN